MSKSCVISGGMGDAVYQIPAMRGLGITDVHIHFPFFDALKRLLKSQGFAVHSFLKEPPKVDYVLDYFRKQRNRGKNHIMLSIARQFGVSFNADPWLEIPAHSDIDPGYSVVHLTGRWREGSKVDWRSIVHKLKQGRIYFIGLQHEWVDFCYKYGDVPWFATEDIYEFAQVIAGADSVYCNQSVSLALAQSMGKTYYLDKKPNKTNTLLYTPNEHLL